jgi:hypothetical protein
VILNNYFKSLQLRICPDFVEASALLFKAEKAETIKTKKIINKT